jgi:hypothetical protein
VSKKGPVGHTVFQFIDGALSYAIVVSCGFVTDITALGQNG